MVVFKEEYLLILYKNYLHTECDFFQFFPINTNVTVFLYIYIFLIKQQTHFIELDQSKSVKSQSCAVLSCYPSILCHCVEMASFFKQVARRIKFHYFTSIKHHHPGAVHDAVQAVGDGEDSAV